jgi:uncharacterized RDD family membrane protein YckC
MASSQVAPGAIPQPSFAGLGRRFWAHIIDTLIAGSVLFAVSFAMRRLRAAGVWTALEEADPVTVWHAMAIPAKLSIIVAFIISLGPIYLGFFEASAWQASIGKRLLGIYVTDVSGRQPTLGRSLARSFAKCVFHACYVWVISLVTIASSAQKQAVHDAIAKTVVVRGRPWANGQIEIWEIVSAFGIPFLWLLITFLVVFRSIE